MTVETKTVFEIGDIEAIDYECTKCHARIVRPLRAEPEHPQHVPLKCANCQSELVLDGGNDTADLRAMMSALTRFADGVNRRVKIRFHIPHK